MATQRASENVDQDIVKLNGRNKVEVLHEMLIRPEFEKVLPIWTHQTWDGKADDGTREARILRHLDPRE